MDVDPGATFSSTVYTGVTGQTGLLAVQVVEPGTMRVVTSRTTAGIAEFPAGSATYGTEFVAPNNPGMYGIIWDTAGSGALSPSNTFSETFNVNAQPLVFADGWNPFGGIVAGPNANLIQQIDDAPAGSNPIPTAADVRAASQLSWVDYGAGLGQDSGPAGLQELVNRAESAFYNITGNNLDSIDPKFAPQVRRVIQGMTETLAAQSSSDVLDTQSDWDLIQSFSAGPYSEQHRSPADMFQARMLWPVPWISIALWGLLDPERYSFWISFFSGHNQPAWTTSEVFWEQGQVLGNLFGPGAGYWWGA